MPFLNRSASWHCTQTIFIRVIKQFYVENDFDNEKALQGLLNFEYIGETHPYKKHRNGQAQVPRRTQKIAPGSEQHLQSHGLSPLLPFHEVLRARGIRHGRQCENLRDEGILPVTDKRHEA